MVFCPEGKGNSDGKQRDDLLPPGEYLVRITSANEGEFGSGAKYIGMRFTVLDGPHDGKSFSEKVILWKCTGFGSALGFEKIERGGKFGYDINAEDLMGAELFITTEIDEYLAPDKPAGTKPLRTTKVKPWLMRPAGTTGKVLGESPF